MSDYYDQKYREKGFYWGKHPSRLATRFLHMFPPEEGQKLLDIGCGEGRDSIFFARNGYQVTGFDFSPEGVKKAVTWASSLNLPIEIFHADVNQFRMEKSYDVVFSSGAFHYIPQHLRKEIIANYKQFTKPGGLHVLMVPVHKPFLEEDPNWDPLKQIWLTGEILTYYYDWIIEFFREEIREENSGYRWALNQLIARDPSNGSVLN